MYKVTIEVDNLYDAVKILCNNRMICYGCPLNKIAEETSSSSIFTSCKSHKWLEAQKDRILSSVPEIVEIKNDENPA